VKNVNEFENISWIYYYYYCFNYSNTWASITKHDYVLLSQKL